ncbi:chromosome segregation protein SMC [Janibacter cremeus]|uniref:chromosome segregation protein SMC n=1 Tax=Janibacter cremeus TaxID=1285192 RepID=UPI0023F99E92|nr:chromosome segregation protein SMC [Janibacter cremeus]WEV78462.1 chromosome segregation protein SMC [Janibacter cremeus]
MYVKSLTLKGFKSFASSTHLRLEPGITCIVGPNGSGKSNVVDALAWVMGEQGAKSLRGGKMEDVIFAGTTGRAALGRAEVTMTIDNTDGALPIDYSEVTISRTMFRNGGSEYAINGTSCRLLDIQELLSDSGIGREMHVIVGQGQLDAVLRATAEDRRGFIEEAAGVLKHRKRKEKALRKLDGMEANLSRVADLTSEIRRQLGPLGRQAETARKAAVIQADARDARHRLLADDLVRMTSALEQEVADEEAMLARRKTLEEAVAAVRDRITAHEEAGAAATAQLAAARDRAVRLASLTDKLTATAELAAERVRLLGQDEEVETTSGRDPEALRAQAARAREDEDALRAEIAEATDQLAETVAAREAAEKAFAEEQRRITALAQRAADRREGLARLAGQVGARRSRIEAAEAEVGRLRESVSTALARADEAEREFTRLESTIADEEGSEEGLDDAYEKAAGALDEAAAQVEKITEAGRTAERDRQSAQARLEALELSLRRKDGVEALKEASADEHEILGSVAELVAVSGGHEAAVAAALDQAGNALAVGSVDAAARAVERLRSEDSGRAHLVVGATARPRGRDGWPSLPSHAVWALDVVTAPTEVRPAVEQVLERVAIVPDTPDALALLSETGDLTVVTGDGDVYGPGFVRGGSSAAPSLLELQAAVDETRAVLEDATRRSEESTFALTRARETLAERAEARDAAMEALHESDARMAAVAEQLGALGTTARTARAEAERTQSSIAQATDALESDRAELAELEQRLEDASAEPAEDEGDDATDDRDRLELEAASARTAETEVRLALRTKEERARSLHGRAESLEGAARNEIAARERLRERRERRRREAEVAAAVETAARWSAGRIAAAAETAGRERDAGESARAERDEALRGLRTELTEQQDALRELTDEVHRDEVARAQQVARIEQLQTRAVEELGVDPDVLMEEFGPHQLVPHVPGPDEDPESADFPPPQPYERAVQEKRLRAAERGLKSLGKVNPLALEEFAALEERHTFLTTQLEDLRRSKQDLLDIVSEIDERVEQVFAEAFADTAEQFRGVFSRLFPGGEGKLVLTDPGNMLTTGIEVEARPPGKKVKRLSLLSGGERSLVAVALLVAIFKARPSPFYIMDEVEAALDDTNLGRLIMLFEELRDSSQLIVITHQKKTMEVADALYGVSMRGDGITTVVSQRLRDVAPEGEQQPA